MHFANLALNKKFLALTVLSIVALAILTTNVFLQTRKSEALNEAVKKTELPFLIKVKELKTAVVQVQQFLTDVSATRGQNGLNDGFDLAEENAAKFRQLSRELGELHPETKATLDDISAAFDSYYTVGKQMAHAYVAGGPAKGNILMPEFDGVAEALSNRLEPFVGNGITLVNEALVAQLSINNETIFFVLITSMLLAVIFGVLVMQIRKLIADIGTISNSVNAVSGGNLGGANISLKRNDEIADLAVNIDHMRANISGMVSQIGEATHAVSQTSDTLKNVAHSTTRHIKNERDEINHIASAMNEMLSTSHEVANNAERVAEAAGDARLETKDGGNMAQQTIAAVTSLADDVANSTRVIRELHENSMAIDRIIEVINDIAEQTNLLALNAAIEAARAGEQGRGFAVVADEVRTLAQRTQKSTGEISGMIERLQATASSTAQAMEQGHQKAQTSVESVTSVGEKLQAIEHSVASIADMVDSIASAATEQSATSEEINRNICNISEATEQTMEEAQQLQNANEEVCSVSKQLVGCVSRFRTN